MSAEREQVIKLLKEKGCRITKQRRMLLDIILENQCASCKEIYLKVSKENGAIGQATVYRMVKELEEVGVLSRRIVYKDVD